MSLSRQFLIEIFKTSSDRRFPWWRWRRWRSWIFYIVIKRPNFSVCGVPNFHKRKYWIEKQCKEQSKNKQLLEWNIWARRGDDNICSSLGHIGMQHAAMLQIALSNFDRMFLYIDIDIHNIGSFKNFWFFENAVEVLRTSIIIFPHLVNIYVVQWCQNWLTLAAELQWLDHSTVQYSRVQYRAAVTGLLGTVTINMFSERCRANSRSHITFLLLYCLSTRAPSGQARPGSALFDCSESSAHTNSVSLSGKYVTAWNTV